jgi:hypothetical protein
METFNNIEIETTTCPRCESLLWKGTTTIRCETCRYCLYLSQDIIIFARIIFDSGTTERIDIDFDYRKNTTSIDMLQKGKYTDVWKNLFYSPGTDIFNHNITLDRLKRILLFS